MYMHYRIHCWPLWTQYHTYCICKYTYKHYLLFHCAPYIWTELGFLICCICYLFWFSYINSRIECICCPLRFPQLRNAGCFAQIGTTPMIGTSKPSRPFVRRPVPVVLPAETPHVHVPMDGTATTWRIAWCGKAHIFVLLTQPSPMGKSPRFSPPQMLFLWKRCGGRSMEHCNMPWQHMHKRT